MGWRAWDAYDREARARLRALPWRDQLPNWRTAVTVVAIFAIVVAYLWASIARSAPINSADVQVIDGDTIRINRRQPDVRLVGFNAPETVRAVCDAERKLGTRATTRLRQLVKAGKLNLEFVACACSPGTEGTPACNYGRRCGTLKANGRDVGATLIAESLAVPFECSGTRCPATPRPWCNAITAPMPVLPQVTRKTKAPSTYKRKGRGGCGSRGGPGYRLPNGRCASWRDRR